MTKSYEELLAENEGLSAKNEVLCRSLTSPASFCGP